VSWFSFFACIASQRLQDEIDDLKAALAAEREAVLVTINELMGSELDRNPMFSEGHDYALERIETFIRARSET